MTTTIAPETWTSPPAPGPQQLTALFQPNGLSKTGRRLLRRILAGLTPDDREDVLQSARAWCWSRRMVYDLISGVPTEAWYLGAVRDAKKQLLRARAKHAAESLDDDTTGVAPAAAVLRGDTTSARAEALEAAEKLAAALPEDYRRVVQLEAEGCSREEMVMLGVPERTVNAARARIRQLQWLQPEDRTFKHPIKRLPTALRRAVRRKPKKLTAAPAVMAPRDWNSDAAVVELSPIDRALAALDRPPRYKPERGVSARELLKQVDDPDVRAAIERTEARKREIG